MISRYEILDCWLIKFMKMWPNKVGIKTGRFESQKLNWINDANNNVKANLLPVPFLFAKCQSYPKISSQNSTKVQLRQDAYAAINFLLLPLLVGIIYSITVNDK